MEYTLFILLLPFLSFLILGLAGMKMKHQVAGAIGTAALLGVAALSYLTAFDYFTAGRTAEGVYYLAAVRLVFGAGLLCEDLAGG